VNLKRLLVLSVVFALAGAVPAWAHEEINPSTFPVNKPVFLTLTTANDKQVKLTKVTITAPQGLDFGGATRSSPGWTAARTDTAVTWTGSSLDPGEYETFGFEIEGADQPGTLTYKATLSYADGSSDDVSVPVTATAAEATTSSSTSKSSGSGRANAALALGVLALLAAGAALVRGGRGPAAAPSSATAKSAAEAQQDW
jgi:hypothetical protein